jgi:hypothetical protein
MPDKERGWGAQGYWVKDTKYERYADWVQMTISDHLRDPSFVALGVQSGDIVGMHPSNCLILDDIIDEKVAVSAREMENVKNSLRANILPTTSRSDRKPFIGVAFTPWRDDDAYAMLYAGGKMRMVVTPVYVEVEGRREYAWPEAWNDEIADQWRRSVGSVEFARMFMCDLRLTRGVNLRLEWLHSFMMEKIDPTWPLYMGADFASTAEKVRNDKHDYFSVAWGRQLPMSGMVLEDGFREILSTGEAIEKLVALASVRSSLRVIGVEKWGKGEEFFNLLRANTRLPVIPLPVKGTPIRSKGERFEKQLAPLFEYGRFWVADAETPWLRAFRSEWAAWPEGDNDDTLDSVYWLAVAAQGNLIGNVNQHGNALEESKKPANAFSALGRVHADR